MRVTVTLNERACEKVLRRIGRIITTKARELVPKDEGRLRDSIDYKVEGTTVTVYTPLEYAWVMEYGRQPGRMPPVEPLREWAKRHGLEGKEWAIAKKIQREGIKAGTVENPVVTPTGQRPFLRPAVYQSIPFILRELKKNLESKTQEIR